MSYLAVGFLGVLLGAIAATGGALLILRRMVDRDLLERRLRVLAGLREALGPTRPAEGILLDPLELDQVVRDLQGVAREFRLTAWLFDARVRAEVAHPILAFEEETRRREAGGGPSPFKVLEAHRQMELALRQAADRSLRDHRRFRLFAIPREEGAEDGAEGMEADLRSGGAGRDLRVH